MRNVLKRELTQFTLILSRFGSVESKIYQWNENFLLKIREMSWYTSNKKTNT